MTLREIRKEAGLNQRELAELIGCSRRTVEDWETGRREIKPWMLKLIEFYITHREEEDS